MPDPTPATTPPINLSEQVAQQITALTDAMRQLADSQKTLLDAMKPKPPDAPAPTPPPAPAAWSDISGDPTGGVTPGALAAVDYSKLSPLQQITLGLRDTRPAPTAPRAGAD